MIFDASVLVCTAIPGISAIMNTAGICLQCNAEAQGGLKQEHVGQSFPIPAQATKLLLSVSWRKSKAHSAWLIELETTYPAKAPRCVEYGLL